MLIEVNLTIESPEISGKDWLKDWGEYKLLDNSFTSMLLTIKTDDGIFNYRVFDESDDVFHDFVDKFRTFYQTAFLTDDERESDSLAALALMEEELARRDSLPLFVVDVDKLKQIEKSVHACCFDEEDGTFFDDESKELWESVKARLNKVWQRLEELSQKSIEEETSAE